MQTQSNGKKFFSFFLIIAVIGIVSAQTQAVTLSPKMQKQLTTLASGASVGTAIVAFNTSNGLQNAHPDVLKNVGITGVKTEQVSRLVRNS